MVIQPEVFDDIQEAIDWYNTRQSGLGKMFFDVVENEFDSMRSFPGFQVRYDDVRCLPVKGFPYMIHFVLNDDIQTVVVMGVINTNRNPEIWEPQKKSPK